jgi:D-threo-aldose 1-dehydrogenase
MTVYGMAQRSKDGLMDPRKRNRLGATDVEVSCFGFGGAPLGERFVRIDNATADRVVEAALDAGIDYFDTAPQYGQGKSEARLGRVLQTRPRDGFVLSTKVGHLFEPPKDRHAFEARIKGNGHRFEGHSDYTRDGVLRSYEHSLLRLGMNRVDMLVIHDLDVFHHGSRDAVDRHLAELTKGGGWRALEELKAAGEIRAIGCGVNALGQVPEMLDHGDVDFFLVAMPYTLLDQGALDVEFPLIEARGASVVIGAVFASGILATGPKDGASYGYDAAPEPVKAKVRAIQRVCDAHGVSLQAAALQFPLLHPLVAAIIPGAYRVENIRDNLASFRAAIPAGFWSDLVSEGLVRADAPIAEA